MSRPCVSPFTITDRRAIERTLLYPDLHCVLCIVSKRTRLFLRQNSKRGDERHEGVGGRPGRGGLLRRCDLTQSLLHFSDAIGRSKAA